VDTPKRIVIVSEMEKFISKCYLTNDGVALAVKRGNVGARKAAQEVRITHEALRKVSLVGAYI